MDSNTLDKISNYLDKIPTEISDALLDKNVDSRIQEISKKYGLNDNQTESLSNIVISVITGIDNYTELKQLIVSDTNVSEFVAEQIIGELESRVFDYILKEFEKKPDENESKSKIPEIRPGNLPVAEKQNSSFTSRPQNPAPVYTPKPKIVVDREVVQKPFSTPTFKAVPMSDIESGQDFMPKIDPKPSANGIMDSKLNSVTKGINETKKEAPPPAKYSSDPYREPLN